MEFDFDKLDENTDEKVGFNVRPSISRIIDTFIKMELWVSKSAFLREAVHDKIYETLEMLGSSGNSASSFLNGFSRDEIKEVKKVLGIIKDITA